MENGEEKMHCDIRAYSTSFLKLGICVLLWMARMEMDLQQKNCPNFSSSSLMSEKSPKS